MNDIQLATFGGGCFWCIEAIFQRVEGVLAVNPGYAGGDIKNPTYKEVCSGSTGHAEVACIEFEPQKVSFEQLLNVFWQAHDPTTLNRQGNDVGTQYRSGIYTYEDTQLTTARISRTTYEQALVQAGHRGAITTEIVDAPSFYYAEDYHQQYLAKNPHGYCGLGGGGVDCPSWASS